MMVDMQRLGLSEKLLEENGLDFGSGRHVPKPYDDSSSTPHAQHRFDHTKQTHTHVPVAPRIGDSDGAQRTPDQPGHPDHAMLEQIRGHMRELDRSRNREYDARSEQLSHSLLTLAKDNGLSRIDHVVLSAQTTTLKPGENIFVVEGQMDDMAHRRACMKTEVAAQTPVTESNRQLEVVNERLAQDQVVTQQREQLQTAFNPHTMRI